MPDYPHATTPDPTPTPPRPAVLKFPGAPAATATGAAGGDRAGAPRREDRPSASGRRPTSPRVRTWRAALEVALEVEQAVLGEGKHADRAIAAALRARAHQGRGPALALAQTDQRFISQSVFAPVPLARLDRPAPPSAPRGPAALAWLLDAPRSTPSAVSGPASIGRDPGQLVALGDAPELDRTGRGTEALARRPRRHRRPLAALPRLAPRTPAPAAQRGHAQGPLPRAAPRPAGPPPLWVRAQGARTRSRPTQPRRPLDRAPRGRSEALGPSPHPERGQAAGRLRRPPPPRLRTRRPRDPGPRLAGRRPRLRPRPRRALVGRLRRRRRQGAPPRGPDGRQGGRRRHRRQRAASSRKPPAAPGGAPSAT